MLTRLQMLSANDTVIHLKSIDIPEWGGSVFLRVLSGRQRERFEASVGKGNETNLRGLFAMLCVCEEDGKPVFGEQDIAALGEKSSMALDRIYKAGIRLNAIGKEGIDTLEKNSEAATSDATPTASLPDTTSPTSIDS
jgi:hypothetical protein